MTALPLHVAYLVNHYPKVSHSFIRREIAALERLGVAISRFSIRGAADRLVDDQDREEQTKTRYLLKGSAIPLLLAVLEAVLFRPRAFLLALVTTRRLMRKSGRSFLRHLASLAEACLLSKWLRQSGASHLHAHFGTNSAEVALLTRALGGPPFSFTVHGPEEFDSPEFLGLRTKSEAAEFVVAVSAFGRSQLLRWVPAGEWSKVKVVHCGIERAFHEGADGLPPPGRRLLTVGRLCEQKGQLALLDACGELVRRGVEFELVLAGDGEMRPQVEARIAELHLGDRVTITGWVSSDRVRQEIEAARAVVMPSFAEGLPVVLMEAMSLGRPVVSTYVAGIPELVRPGREGWLVPAGDVEALADALSECLLADGPELERLAVSCRQRALERHDIDREAAKLRSLFEPSRSGS